MADPYFSSVTLLCLNDSQADASTTFDDQSNANRTITANGNVQYDTAQAPTGLTSSGLFDATGDFLSMDSSADFGFGTGDLTIEGFARYSDNTGSQTFIDLRAAGGSVEPMIRSTGGNLIYHTAGTAISAAAPAAGAWFHFALTRVGATTTSKMFVNGTQHGSTYSTDTSNFGSAPCRVGMNLEGTEGFNGWLASVRVTKGVARYTADFTPPSLPLELDSSSQLLAPISDISAGPWLTSSGSPAELWQMIDGEKSPDTDYDYTTSAGTMEVKFAPGSTPSLQTGHTLRYRLRGNGTCDALVKLKVGSTVLAQWTETNVPAVDTDYEHTLDSSPSFSITDYSDLRISVEAIP
jgi:hypothetical protein